MIDQPQTKFYRYKQYLNILRFGSVAVITQLRHRLWIAYLLPISSFTCGDVNPLYGS